MEEHDLKDIWKRSSDSEEITMDIVQLVKDFKIVSNDDKGIAFITNRLE